MQSYENSNNTKLEKMAILPMKAEISEAIQTATNQVGVENIGLFSLNEISSAIKKHAVEVGAHFIRIGLLLNQANAKVEHGKWLKWLEQNTDLNRSVASRLMRIAKAFPNGTPVAQMGYSKALLLLDVPEDKRKNFIEKPQHVNFNDDHAKFVHQMSKRELQEVIRRDFKSKPNVKLRNLNNDKTKFKQLSKIISGLQERLNEDIDFTTLATELHELSVRLQEILDQRC